MTFWSSTFWNIKFHRAFLFLITLTLSGAVREQAIIWFLWGCQKEGLRGDYSVCVFIMRWVAVYLVFQSMYVYFIQHLFLIYIELYYFFIISKLEGKWFFVGLVVLLHCLVFIFLVQIWVYPIFNGIVCICHALPLFHAISFDCFTYKSTKKKRFFDSCVVCVCVLVVHACIKYGSMYCLRMFPHFLFFFSFQDQDIIFIYVYAKSNMKNDFFMVCNVLLWVDIKFMLAAKQFNSKHRIITDFINP